MNEQKKSPYEFKYNRWELGTENGHNYILELDNEAVMLADRRFPLKELQEKGIVEQIESFLTIFTLKNHKFISSNIIKNIALEIINNKSVEDIIPELQMEYVRAFEMVFTSKGADNTTKKTTFKKF